MHTRYKIYKHVYRVSNLVKIQTAKIYSRSGDHSGEVLPLELKEFVNLDNSPIYKVISIIEAAKLQSNFFMSNKGSSHIQQQSQLFTLGSSFESPSFGSNI
ncbi:13580_t:CDS:2, partial [Racocetra persica]